MLPVLPVSPVCLTYWMCPVSPICLPCRMLLVCPILANDLDTLLNFTELGEGARLAVPVPAEHFLPLLYVLAQREDGEPVEIFNDEIIAGSLSMTSVKVG